MELLDSIEQVLIFASPQRGSYSAALELENGANLLDLRFQVLESSFADAIDVWIEESVDGSIWNETNRLEEYTSVSPGDTGALRSSVLGGRFTRFGLSVFSQAQIGALMLGVQVTLFRQ